MMKQACLFFMLALGATALTVPAEGENQMTEVSISPGGVETLFRIAGLESVSVLRRASRDQLAAPPELLSVVRL